MARARGVDEYSADDVVQETLTRLVTASRRLEESAHLPFALTTAGNLVVGMRRSADRDRRHQHRLVDRLEPDDPSSVVEAVEQAVAVRAALSALDPRERDLLMAHVDGASTIELASLDGGTTPAAVAARLARTRARLRLDYLLALRRVDLPSIACRRVLLAVSAADARRQKSLNAAGHLSTCSTCTELVPALAARRSGLAGIASLPLVGLGRLGGQVRRLISSHPVPAASGIAAVAVAAGIIVVVTPSHSTSVAAAVPVSAPSRSSVAVPDVAVRSAGRPEVRIASGGALLPLSATGRLRSLVGQRIAVRDMPVQSVVSHPGFWIGTSATQRIYVHIDRPQLIRARNPARPACQLHRGTPNQPSRHCGIRRGDTRRGRKTPQFARHSPHCRRRSNQAALAKSSGWAPETCCPWANCVRSGGLRFLVRAFADSRPEKNFAIRASCRTRQSVSIGKRINPKPRRAALTPPRTTPGVIMATKPTPGASLRRSASIPLATDPRREVSPERVAGNKRRAARSWSSGWSRIDFTQPTSDWFATFRLQRSLAVSDPRPTSVHTGSNSDVRPPTRPLPTLRSTSFDVS